MSRFSLLFAIFLSIFNWGLCDNVTVQRFSQEKSDDLLYVVTNGHSQQMLLDVGDGNLACLNQDMARMKQLMKGASHTLSSADTKSFLLENGKTMRKCFFNDNRKKRSVLDRIFPGTKWCGVGNIAANETDFGEEIETDKCCHDHDRCSNFLRSGERKLGYKNTYSYTLMDCSCDDTFYLCLKEVENQASEEIGRFFFNLIKVKCFKEEPIDKCVSWIIPGMWCRQYQLQSGIRIYNSPHWN